MLGRGPLTEREIRALVAVRRGALRQTPEGLRCLPVEPTPEERARVLADAEHWAAAAVPIPAPTCEE